MEDHTSKLSKRWQRFLDDERLRERAAHDAAEAMVLEGGPVVDRLEQRELSNRAAMVRNPRSGRPLNPP